MYQEPVKITKKKKIEVIILLLILIWLILFILNYFRYTNGQPLFISIHRVTEYEEGQIEEYISLGYIYRIYNLNSYNEEELVPIWVSKKQFTAKDELPKPLTDYEVPDNIRKQDKYMGLLYYYSRSGQLLGTYKCLNSVRDCNKATSGYDEYNILNADPLTAREVEPTLDMIHEKFAFVDDSKAQDTSYGKEDYQRTIYLYNFTLNEEEILAQYADIKESTYDQDYNLANKDSDKFIVKSQENLKWGLIQITEAGTIKELLPFEYDSINYDEDTNYYILSKENTWYVYNLNKQEKVSIDSSNPIYNVWHNSNMTYYIKTGVKKTIADEEYITYQITRIDGHQFLNTDNITQIVERDNYLMYVTANDNILHFIDYTTEEKYHLQLAFFQMQHTKLTHPAFAIVYEYPYSITLDIYKGRQLADEAERVYVNTTTWDND